MRPRETLELFDLWLEDRSVRLEAVIIGGSALGLLGITARQTRDVDVLVPAIPEAVAVAAREFAAARRALGEVLRDDWLNNGPGQVATLLPAGWDGRVQSAYVGRSILLHTLGRSDLLLTKLFALCDRGTDLADCIALAPSPAELAEALPWVQWQDANPDWPRHVEEVLVDLARRLGHGA